MTDTFRALCAELTYCWSRTTNPDDFAENAAPIIGRMRAALAQPEPEGVEDRIAKLEADLDRERLRLAACGVVAMADTPESAAKARDMSPECHSASLADVIRQIDALMELRDALSQPEPEGPTEEELHDLWLELYGFHPDGPTSGDVAVIARAVLARWGSALPTPQP
jgi:hypothetical protein